MLKINFLHIRLELNGQRRRLTWEATPRSIHEGVSSAIMNSDCLVFDTSIAQLFADNGNLGINVTISMVWRWCAVEFITASGIKEGTTYWYAVTNENSVFWHYCIVNGG